MITTLLISLLLSGSPDSTKTVNKLQVKAKEQTETLKRIERKQKDTIRLIEALKAKKAKENKEGVCIL